MTKLNTEIKINSPYTIKEILFTRRYPGYIYRREIVDASGFIEELKMINCYSSDTGDWIGNNKQARMLCNNYGLRNIQKKKPSDCVCSIGFNFEEQKWYGWSHRALYGFGIGSKVKKGDCAYVPTNEEDAIEDHMLFWLDKYHVNMRHSSPSVNSDGQRGILIEWDYPDTLPNEKLRNTVCGQFCYLSGNYGMGEWEAKTLEDAKQMAMDFSDGVS